MATPANNKQIPDHAILDYFGKQIYLGNGFILPVNSISLANTTETVIALITNPSTTQSSVLNKAMFMGLQNISSNGAVFLRYYIAPTVSAAGSATIPSNLRPANSNASISDCYLSPTITVKGTLLQILGCDDQNNSNCPIILDAGQSLLITAQNPNAGTVVCNLSSSWNEI